MDIVLHSDTCSLENVRQITAIHRHEIGQGFLTSLGDKPLELIFSHLTKSRFGILITAEDHEHGTLCGFICGTTNTRSLYQDFLAKHMFPTLFYVMPKLLTFQTLKKVLETLTYPSRQSTNLPDPELLDLAVSREYWGSGVSQKLFGAFVSSMRARNVKRFRIGTGINLKQAQRFYEKQGARLVSSFQIHEGETSLYYIYDIED